MDLTRRTLFYLSMSILLCSLASSDACSAHARSCDCSIITDTSNMWTAQGGGLSRNIGRQTNGWVNREMHDSANKEGSNLTDTTCSALASLVFLLFAVKARQLASGAGWDRPVRWLLQRLSRLRHFSMSCSYISGFTGLTCLSDW